jgi:hypothetical protein
MPQIEGGGSGVVTWTIVKPLFYLSFPFPSFSSLFSAVGHAAIANAAFSYSPQHIREKIRNVEEDRRDREE